MSQRRSDIWRSATLRNRGFSARTANSRRTTFEGGASEAGAGVVFRLWLSVPPSISSVTATPNYSGHQITKWAVSLTVSATGIPVPVCGISAVASNEPPTRPRRDGLGRYETPALNLRAERLGSGNGRVYTITVTCTNGVNPNASQSVAVIVPHDQGR